MPEQKSEFQEFVKEIKDQEPSTLEEALGLKPNEQVPEKGENEPEEEPLKNRKHRRWETRLEQREREILAREARIAALEELEERDEVKRAGDIDPRLLTLFGTEERGKEAAALLQQILDDKSQSTAERMRSELEAMREQEAAEVSRNEALLDDNFESLEEEYGVDFTSNAPAARKARNEILDLLEKYSPKDQDGSIIEYADMNGVYEAWQMQKERQRPSNTRQKELASRSMESGTQAPSNEPKQTPGFRGWMRDFGL